MILDQVIAGARGDGQATVTLEGLRDSIGLLGFDDLNGVAQAVAARDVPGTLTAFDRALGRGVAVDHFLAELVEYFRSVLFLKHGLNRDAWLSAPADAFPRGVLDAISVEQAEKAVELLLAAQRNLKGALNERCEVELALSRLAELDRLITPAEVLERLRELQAAVGAPAPAAGGPPPLAPARSPASAPAAPAGEPAPAAAAATGSDASGEPAGAAPQPIDALRQRRPPVASALERAESVEFHGEELRVRFAKGDGYPADTVREHAAEVAAAYGLAGPGTISVQLGSGEDDPDDHEGAAAPGVEMIRSIFRGEIVQGGG